jgi:hypothetical protein
MIVGACASLYARYCNDSPNECRLSSDKTNEKLCDRLIFAELYWGLKGIKLLKSTIVKIPTHISLSTAVRNITKLLDDTAANIQNAKVGGKDHSECASTLLGVRRSIQTTLDKVGPLSLDMFERKMLVESRVSWERMLPIRESKPQPQPRPRPQHRSIPGYLYYEDYFDN